MISLAAVLLAMLAVVHYGPDVLAYAYPDHDAARRAIYYIARSIEGAIQYAVIALLTWWGRPKEASRSKDAAPTISPALLVVLPCCWGVIEHLQAGVCRLSIGIANRPPPGAALTGICDEISGLPLYALGLGAVAFLAAVIAAQSLGR